MKISVITVCYNSAATIADALASVRDQDHRDVEHIVIDGGSSDGTVDEIRRHEAGLAFWSSGPDQGIYDAMNKGIARATGEVIGLLNADDLYAHRMVLSHVAAAFADSTVEACYGNLVYVEPDSLDMIVRYWESTPYRDGLFERGWCPPHPTFYVRSDVYRRCGGFDLSCAIGNDVELMARFLARCRVKSVYLPEIMVRMRLGGVSNSSVSTIIAQNREIIRVLRKDGLKVNMPRFIALKLLTRAGQYLRRPQI